MSQAYHRQARHTNVNRSNLHLQEFTPLLPWLSVSFVIAGYLYTHWLYGSFGIDVSQFFSLNDYLASSIEEIWNSLSILFGYFLTILNNFRNYIVRTKYGFQKKDKFGKLSYFIFLFILLISSYIFYLYNIPIYYRFSLISVCFLSIPLIKFFTIKFSKNSQFSFFLLLSLLLFFTNLHSSAYERIASIKKGDSGIDFEIEVGTRKFTHENSTFIGGNTRYIFLYTQSGSVEIIPIGQTERIGISTR